MRFAGFSLKICDLGLSHVNLHTGFEFAHWNCTRVMIGRDAHSDDGVVSLPPERTAACEPMYNQRLSCAWRVVTRRMSDKAHRCALQGHCYSHAVATMRPTMPTGEHFLRAPTLNVTLNACLQVTALVPTLSPPGPMTALRLSTQHPNL